jgi:hypothetical protein
MIQFLIKNNSHNPININLLCILILERHNAKEVFLMGDFVTLVTNVGFPIAVATYLLIRFESKIDGLTQSIDQLTAVVNKQQSFKDDKVA